MPTPGERFNPYRMFTGIFIPEVVIRLPISSGAKLLYGRLGRFAGRRGFAFPKLDVLGESLGLKRRQAQKYLGELEGRGLIVIEKGGPGQPNRYYFVWHPSFEQDIRNYEATGDSACLDTHFLVSRGALFGTGNDQKVRVSKEESQEESQKRTPPTPPRGCTAGTQDKPKRLTKRQRLEHEMLRSMDDEEADSETEAADQQACA